MEHNTVLITANNAAMEIGSQMMEHLHICYQLYYILEGDPVFIIDGNELCAHAGSFFYISPQIPHQMLPLMQGKMLCYEFKVQIKNSFLVDHLPRQPVQVSDSGYIHHLLDYVYRNWRCKDEQNISSIDSIFTTLLSGFFLPELQYNQTDSCRIQTEHYSQLTRSIMAYVENHYQNHVSLEKMSKDLNYNSNYLSTSFSKNTGISIIDYLNLIRVRQSVIIFGFYAQDVFTACESSGFSSPSYFSRAFKQLTGASPRSFKYVFSKADRSKLRPLFTQEPILNLQICTLEEALSSLRSIGAAVNRIMAEMNSN